MLALSNFFAAVAVHAQSADEEQELRAREAQLTEKVHALRSEQEQLLVRKALYSSDSKYLEIDLRSGEGALRYRTRVLKTFQFTKRGHLPKPLPEGRVYALTSKEDGSSTKRRLLFNNAALVIEGKNYKGKQGSTGLFLSISRKDLAAIYYALEAGSIAYFKP